MPHRYGLARTLYQLGEFDEARALFDTLRREQPDSVAYLGYLGSIAARQDDRERAIAIAAGLVALDRRFVFGSIQYWQARIAAVLGDDELAMVRLREALDRGLTPDPSGHVDGDLVLLRDYAPYQQLRRPSG